MCVHFYSETASFQCVCSPGKQHNAVFIMNVFDYAFLYRLALARHSLERKGEAWWMRLIPSLSNSSRDFGWIGKKSIAAWQAALPQKLCQKENLCHLYVWPWMWEEWQPPQCDSTDSPEAGAQEPGVLGGWSRVRRALCWRSVHRRGRRAVTTEVWGQDLSDLGEAGKGKTG